MSLYQRKIVATGQDIGAPAALPAELIGLADDVLADLSAHLDPAACAELGYSGQGFVPIPPEPAPTPVRWLHKALLLQRIPAPKRIAIRAAEASDPIIADFMFLLTQSDDVDLDTPNLVAGLGYLLSKGLVDANDVAAVRA